jgi:hypothetical protein
MYLSQNARETVYRELEIHHVSVLHGVGKLLSRAFQQYAARLPGPSIALCRVFFRSISTLATLDIN